MNLLRLLPVILSLLLLGAHFSRHNLNFLILLPLVLLGLLFLRQPWVARLVQWVLVIAAAEWLRTAVVLALQRQAQGMPWGRSAVILGAVCMVTLLSALVFRSAGLRERYRLTDS
jgi:hypothetical protein